MAAFNFTVLLATLSAAAVAWADQSLDENPRYTAMLRYKLVACAHLGRIGPGTHRR